VRGTRAKRERRRPGRKLPRRLPAYLDLQAYLLDRGYLRGRRAARLALIGGKVSVNGDTYTYPHFPKAELEYDDCGRPRIMLADTPDPRPCA
jgi:hypothetical protein